MHQKERAMTYGREDKIKHAKQWPQWICTLIVTEGSSENSQVRTNFAISMEHS